jgi:3-phosphoshikimate 1-carboxyvinyltransferase
MTKHVIERFGVHVRSDDIGRALGPAPQATGYRASTYEVEADAATAAYFLSAAAITGGTVRVPRLPPAALQPDAEFVDLLARMGCVVTRSVDGGAEVSGPADGRLRAPAEPVDLTRYSDMAPTVAVLGAFADGPVEVTGVGFIRGKETDRIAASVAELRRIGVDADETDDGFVVRPGATPHGAVIQTYDDHRMAMSFALVGLVVPGISVADPGVVAKTHPGFWSDLDRLRA